LVYGRRRYCRLQRAGGVLRGVRDDAASLTGGAGGYVGVLGTVAGGVVAGGVVGVELVGDACANRSFTRVGEGGRRAGGGGESPRDDGAVETLDSVATLRGRPRLRGAAGSDIRG
ncbi:unnamed protein product, partial [Ectocarpus sp. 12 AP-2014]